MNLKTPAILLALVSSSAFADGLLDGLDILSPNSSGDGFVGFSLFIVAVILIASFAIGILSIESFPFSILSKIRGHIHASNLFLKVRFSLVQQNPQTPPVFSEKNKPEEMVGFLRSLDFRGATIALRKPIEIGSMVRLDLASLPRFYHGRYQVAGEVTNIQKASKEGDYLVQVQFASIPESVKEPLTNYLKELTA